MKFKKTLIILIGIALSGCTTKPTVDEEPAKVYDNHNALINQSVGWENEPLRAFVADFIIDTTSTEALYNNSTLVLDGDFLGIVESYVDEVGMIYTIYDFKVANSYKGNELDAGDIIQVAVLGGALEYGEFKESLIQLGREEFLENKSEEFIRERYSEEEANRLINEMKIGIDDDELIIQNYYSNPLSTRERNSKNSYLLFLGESEMLEVFKPIALNHGYKIVTKGNTVESVGYPEEVTPVFSIAELETLANSTD